MNEVKKSSSLSAWPDSYWLPLLFVVLFACFVRALLYQGVTLGDDTIYFHVVQNRLAFPNSDLEHTHWALRALVTIPGMVTIGGFGLSSWSPFVFPFLISIAKVFFIYTLAYRLEKGRFSISAGLIAGTFPGDVIYSTQLFPDVLCGFFEPLALVLWYVAVRDDSIKFSLLSGVVASCAYFSRESLVHSWILFALVPVVLRKLCLRPALIAGGIVIFAFLSEMVFYHFRVGDAWFRVTAILAERSSGEDNPAFAKSATTGWRFWLDPIKMLLLSHEYGFTFLLAFAGLIFSFKSNSSLRLISLWFFVGYLWTFYGTTLPTRWALLQRDPRYSLSISVPACLIVAFLLCKLNRFTWGLVLTVVVISNCIFASMDQAGSILNAHRKLIALNMKESVGMHPRVYWGVYWANGRTLPSNYFWLSDVGHRRWDCLKGAHPSELNDVDYVVVPSTGHEEVLRLCSDHGFVKHSEFYSGYPLSRQLLLKFLGKIRSRDVSDAELQGYGLTVLKKQVVHEFE